MIPIPCLSSFPAMSTTSRINTRAKNANAHPGAIIPKQNRRSQAEMQQAREEKQGLKDRQVLKRKEAIDRISRMESHLAAKDEQAKLAPARQPPPPDHKKKRTKTHLDATDKGEAA